MADHDEGFETAIECFNYWIDYEKSFDENEGKTNEEIAKMKDENGDRICKLLIVEYKEENGNVYSVWEECLEELSFSEFV